MTDPSPEEIAAATAVPAAQTAPVERRRATNGSHLPDIHRLLPQSEEAEKALLSSIMNAPAVVEALCWQKGVTKEWFHRPAHQTMFELLSEMMEAGQFPDPIVATTMLRDRKQLDAVGGPVFPMELATYVPTGANAEHYLEILEEKHTLREIIRVTTEYAGRSYEEQGEVTRLLDELEAKVLRISRDRYQQASQGYRGKELAKIGMDAIRARLALRGTISGISTGLRLLDERCDGLHETEFIAIAGKSGTGKSALAMQIVEHLTFDCAIPCAVFSLEMGRKQLAQRIIYTRARVNPYDWRFRSETYDEMRRMEEAAQELTAAPMHIEDASDCTIQRIRAQARRLVTNHKVRVILIDSLSALHSDTRQGRDNRVREAAECSEGCKEMAKELGVTVLLVCHIGRDIQRNERPQPMHLRESGKVELDADSLWFLYEPEFDENAPTLAPEIELYIPKQRDGEPFVTCRLTFEKRHTRFLESAEAGAGQQPDLPII